jgi:hypothetical protein
MYQSPARLVEVRHDVAAASIAVASLRGCRLTDAATIRFPTVKDHDIPTLADEFQIGEGARFFA